MTVLLCKQRNKMAACDKWDPERRSEPFSRDKGADGAGEPQLLPGRSEASEQKASIYSISVPVCFLSYGNYVQTSMEATVTIVI